MRLTSKKSFHGHLDNGICIYQFFRLKLRPIMHKAFLINTLEPGGEHFAPAFSLLNKRGHIFSFDPFNGIDLFTIDRLTNFLQKGEIDIIKFVFAPCFAAFAAIEDFLHQEGLLSGHAQLK